MTGDKCQVDCSRASEIERLKSRDEILISAVTGLQEGQKKLERKAEEQMTVLVAIAEQAKDISYLKEATERHDRNFTEVFSRIRAIEGAPGAAAQKKVSFSEEQKGREMSAVRVSMIAVLIGMIVEAVKWAFANMRN